MAVPQKQMVPHTLVGLEHCYHLHCKKSLDAWAEGGKSAFQRWQRRRTVKKIRGIFDATDGEFSGDFTLHEIATFTDEDVARSICAQKNAEAIAAKPGQDGYGWRWEIKQAPVNRLLQYEPVRYGIAEYSGTDIDAQMRRRVPTELVDCKAVQLVKAEYASEFCQIAEEVEKTLALTKKAVSSL